MRVANLIEKQNIVIDLDVSTQQEAIIKLSEKLFENGFVNNVDGFFEEVLKRESYTTTGVGNGIAIPHGISKYVNESTVIFATTTKGIEWNSLDGSKVNVIFLLAVTPNDKGSDHLKTLAVIASKLMDDTFVSAIKSVNSVDEVMKVLSL